jgi:drug/metabolite transporter (DMT)-like permease
MRSEKFLIIIGFILISLIWGSTWLAIKIGLQSITPFFGIAIRFTIASAILSLIMMLRGEKIAIDRTSKLLYLNLGILSFSFPFALVYWGEQYIASGLASVLFAAYPFVVAFGSHLFLSDEKLDIAKSLGILLGFVGVIIIFWADFKLNNASTLGMVAVLASTIMQGASLVMVKKMNHPISSMSLSLGGMIVGISIMLPLAFIFEDYSALHFDIRGLGSILYLGTFGTVVTFVVYYWLLKRVEVIYLSLVSFVTPIIAVLLGAVWLAESLSIKTFLGAGIVLVGIITANLRDLLRMIIGRQEKILQDK